MERFDFFRKWIAAKKVHAKIAAVYLLISFCTFNLSPSRL